MDITTSDWKRLTPDQFEVLRVDLLTLLRFEKLKRLAAKHHKARYVIGNKTVEVCPSIRERLPHIIQCKHYPKGLNKANLVEDIVAAPSKIVLPDNTLKHGIKREIYGMPLACKFKDFLLGKENDLESLDLEFDVLASHWKEILLKGRAKQKPEFIRSKKESVSEIIYSAIMNKESGFDE